MRTITTNPEQQKWRIMGDNAFNQKDYPNALNYYTQALKQDNNNTIILSKIGNTFFAMEIYPSASFFYEEAFNNSGAFTIIYEYALAQLQSTDLYTLQSSLYYDYQVEIIIEGLRFILTNIKKELKQQKPKKPNNNKQSKPFEKIFIKLVKKIGIPLIGEILDVTQQIKHATSQPINVKNPTIIKKMTGTQFVIFLQKFFQQKGYQVTRKKSTHDFGADLILRKPGTSIVVQAKKRKKSTIGVKAVQEVFTSKAYYQADLAIVITTSKFSRPALKLAEKLGVECWDWEKLQTEINIKQNNKLYSTFLLRWPRPFISPFTIK